MSISRRARMMRALGAEVVLVDQAPGAQVGEVSGEDLARVEAVAQELVAQRQAFRADQFNHPGNAAAHATGTARELWDDSGGTLTAFVDFVGSGGTLAGTLTGLREVAPGLRGYAVEPEGAEALAGLTITSPSHPIQGGGYSMGDLTALADVAIDGFLSVRGDDARRTTQDLARIEGIFAGFSAGANVWAALELLRGPEAGGVIGVVICDSGLKYLSTDLWGE